MYLSHARYKMLNSLQELDLSAAIQCMERNIKAWERVQVMPKQAAQKSLSRPPEVVNNAVAETELERGVRDHATRTCRNMHLTHSKHAALRHLRLRSRDRAHQINKKSYMHRPRSMSFTPSALTSTYSRSIVVGNASRIVVGSASNGPPKSARQPHTRPNLRSLSVRRRPLRAAHGSQESFPPPPK